MTHCCHLFWDLNKTNSQWGFEKILKAHRLVVSEKNVDFCEGTELSGSATSAPGQWM